jgi:hypothetical protein
MDEKIQIAFQEYLLFFEKKWKQDQQAVDDRLESIIKEICDNDNKE